MDLIADNAISSSSHVHLDIKTVHSSSHETAMKRIL